MSDPRMAPDTRVLVVIRGRVVRDVGEGRLRRVEVRADAQVAKGGGPGLLVVSRGAVRRVP